MVCAQENFRVHVSSKQRKVEAVRLGELFCRTKKDAFAQGGIKHLLRIVLQCVCDHEFGDPSGRPELALCAQ